MRRTMKWIAALVAIVVVFAALAAIGLTIEGSRRRELRAFAQEHRGTFEPGSVMAGAPLPEAAPFDAPFLVTSTGDGGGSASGSDETITYRNVARISGDEASYAVALRSRARRNTKDEWVRSSYLVCFVSLARSDLPQVSVDPAMEGFAWPDRLRGWAPVKLELPDPVPGFAKEFEVYTVPRTAKPAPEALDRLLDRTVQAELLARQDLISGLQVRGNVVRIQAVDVAGDQPHRELYEAARKLAIIWAGKRGR